MPRPVPPNLPLPTLGGKQIWADVFAHAAWRIQHNVVTGHHRLLGPGNVRHAWGAYDLCKTAFDLQQRDRPSVIGSDHVVVLLHGIFRAKEVFGPMSRALTAAGFEPLPLNYPSTRRSLTDHADQVATVLERLEGARTVSLVGHSMGGIVGRVLLSRPGAWRDKLLVNRLVTVGSPNRGAEVVDRLGPLWSFRKVAGPSGASLSTTAASDLPLPDCPFGTVAGERGDGRGWNPLIDGEDDGTVAVASALLPEAEDRLVVQGVHTFLMRHPDVIAGTIRYLRTGRFGSAD